MSPDPAAAAHLRRRDLLAAWPLLLGAGVLMSGAARAEAQLPASRSLKDELAAALANKRALVAMVSLEHCPFCKIVRESYLAPLQRQGQPVVQLDMRSSQAVVDFAGAPSTHGQMVKSLGARVAPTVLFFGRGALEAAPRLAGMVIPDFYGAYLQERVDAANRSLA